MGALLLLTVTPAAFPGLKRKPRTAEFTEVACTFVAVTTDFTSAGDFRGLRCTKSRSEACLCIGPFDLLSAVGTVLIPAENTPAARTADNFRYRHLFLTITSALS